MIERKEKANACSLFLSHSALPSLRSFFSSHLGRRKSVGVRVIVLACVFDGVAVHAGFGAVVFLFDLDPPFARDFVFFLCTFRLFFGFPPIFFADHAALSPRLSGDHGAVQRERLDVLCALAIALRASDGAIASRGKDDGSEEVDVVVIDSISTSPTSLCPPRSRCRRFLLFLDDGHPQGRGHGLLQVHRPRRERADGGGGRERREGRPGHGRGESRGR